MKNESRARRMNDTRLHCPSSPSSKSASQGEANMTSVVFLDSVLLCCMKDRGLYISRELALSEPTSLYSTYNNNVCMCVCVE